MNIEQLRHKVIRHKKSGHTYVVLGTMTEHQGEQVIWLSGSSRRAKSGYRTQKQLEAYEQYEPYMRKD